MSRKILINEKQLGVLKDLINESQANVRLKNSINTFLKKDYEPSRGVKRLANEFFDTALIKKKIDNEIITPKALCDYISHKFSGLSKTEIKDSIEGWYHEDYDSETGMRKKK